VIPISFYVPHPTGMPLPSLLHSHLRQVLVLYCCFLRLPLIHYTSTVLCAAPSQPPPPHHPTNHPPSSPRTVRIIPTLQVGSRNDIVDPLHSPRTALLLLQVPSPGIPQPTALRLENLPNLLAYSLPSFLPSFLPSRNEYHTKLVISRQG